MDSAEVVWMNTFVNGLDALLQSLDGGCDVVDACALHQLSVVSVQMLTKLVVTVDEHSQFFCVGDEYLWIAPTLVARTL
jgi:hypothetical protein